MAAIVDLTPYGNRRPQNPERTLLAVTRRLPAGWLGLRLSMPLRRIAMNWIGTGAIDIDVWGMHMRLYPRGNICEKMALFTPHMYDRLERRLLAAAIDERLAAGGTFTFIDIGANVGLYSLFVAARAGPNARILAIEPQPGIVARLMFNLRANPGVKVAIFPVAVADREGGVELVIESDGGGAHLNKSSRANGAETVRVPCRPLTAILDEARITTIDAMKLDIEGAEDLALEPFLYDAPYDRLPHLILIEDRPNDWNVDLFKLLKDRGYVESGRSRQNVIFKLT